MEHQDDEIQDLGVASVETKGRVNGFCYEPSVIPWRLADQTTGQCPKP